MIADQIRYDFSAFCTPFGRHVQDSIMPPIAKDGAMGFINEAPNPIG
jgi:hypothetical protein